MADLLRAVTFDVGGRPQLVVDLNDFDAYTLVADSFDLTPAPKQQNMAPGERRYAGSRQVGETHENAIYSWQHLVRGETTMEVLSRINALVGLLERIPVGDLFIESQLDGAEHPTYREVRATGSWKPTYSWPQLALARSMLVNVQIPVEPLGRAARMDVYDRFDVDTRGDYAYDAGTIADEQISGGALRGAGTLTTERRAIHTARGYDYVDSAQQIEAAPGATITGFKAGVVIKRIDDENYLEAYVDDDGTNSRLRLDKVVAGARTNLRSTNLSSRVSAGRSIWVQPTIENTGIAAYAYTTPPTPFATAARIVVDALAGGDIALFGTGVAGGYGRVWTPQHADAQIRTYQATGHSSTSIAAPIVMPWNTPIPGDAPALCDATITHSGGDTAPVYAMLGWTRRPRAGLAPAPFGIFQSEDATLTGWSIQADAFSHAGNRVEDSTASSAEAYSATWTFDPSLLAADDFDREITVEAWVRALIGHTLIAPTLTLSGHPEDAGYGAVRYTDEWQQAGKVLTVPVTNPVWTMVRLGTIRMLVDPQRPRIWRLVLNGAVGAGSSGYFGHDYLLLVPARQVARSKTGVTNDAGYPRFLATTAEASKTIRHNLSAVVARPPAWGHPDHGLGGQLLELPPGDVDMLVKLSSLVPDDPVPSALVEQLSHTVVLDLSITPRYHLMRA